MRPDDDLAGARSATATVLALADRLAEHPDGLAAPSLLPGWSRAHVVAHLAGNARGHVRMLDGALAGERVAQYPGGPEGRAAEIEELAADPDRAVRAAHDAAAALDERWRRLGPDDWEAPVHPAGSEPMPARELVWSRWREVAVHGVDLDAGYRPEDWAPGVLERVVDDVTGRPGFPVVRLAWATDGPARLEVLDVTVTGSPSALVLWLTGRSAGAGLRVAGPGSARAALPDLPEWR